MSLEIRTMRTIDLDGAVRVWQLANIERGKSSAPERVAGVIDKLRAPSATAYVAADGDAITGMVLLEPYRADDGAGAVVPGALHLAIVFIAPSSQGRSSAAAW